MENEDLDKILFALTPIETEIKKMRTANGNLSSSDLGKRWNTRDINGVFAYALVNTIFPETHLFSKFTILKSPRWICTPDHRHDYIEMVYVYSGKFDQAIGGQKIRVEKGEIFLMNPQTVHSVGELQDDDIAIDFLLSNDFWDSILHTFLHDSEIFYQFIIDALYRNSRTEYLHFHCSQDENIQNHMANLLYENSNAKPGSYSLILGELLIIFSYLLRETELTDKQASLNRRGSWLDALYIYIKDHLNSATLTGAAQHLNFNPNYLSYLLKRSTGKTYTEYVQNIKLNQVCFILENTDYSIENIAKEVGYSNITYFYKIFRNKYNCTPHEYRDKFQSK